MEYGIKQNILELKKTSYAKEKELSGDINYIDCSNGINPLGVCQGVKEALENISVESINTYSKSSLDLRKAIKEYWGCVSDISTDQIIIGDGSIEIIYKVNKLFIDEASKVLGYAPQFSDYVDDVKSYGAIYDFDFMSEESNYKFNAEEYTSRMNKDYSLFYIDNPNNPTGQLIDSKSIREIVEKARALKRPIIIDEAYGDFVRREDSAIALIGEYDNLIVLRTLSKGLGLAGLRAGYMISSKEIVENYLKITNPFEMSNIARSLSIMALEDKNFMKDSSYKISEYKKKFLDSLKKLVVLETHHSVPIITIMHPDKDVDLEKLLLKYNVLSIPGIGFRGLGKNFVRLLIIKDIDGLIETFQEIEMEIQEKRWMKGER